MHAATRARWQILAVALLFSTGGAAIKLCSLSGYQVASFRSGIAALAILLFLPAARRMFPREGQSRLDTTAIWSIAAAYGATMILFVTANKLTTSANAIFLQSSAPLYLLVLGPLLLREPLRRRDLAVLPLFIAGLVAFFVSSPAATATAPDPPTGNALALASGLCFAITLAGFRWLGGRGEGKRGSSAPVIAAGNLIAFVVCLPAALPLASLAGATGQDAVVLLYLGAIQIGLAYVWLTSAIRHVSAFEASLLLLAEPVFNPLWAWLIHGEEPGGWALAGGAAILGASALKAWLEARATRRTARGTEVVPIA